EIELPSNTFTIRQQTNYPWSGQVQLSIQAEKPTETTLKFRIPSWARNNPIPGDLYHYHQATALAPTISVDGQPVEGSVQDGYFTLTRNWEAGATVELNFPMPVQLVEASAKIAEDIGKVALERGPLVYAIEEVDNKAGFDHIKISPQDTFAVQQEPELLGGIFTLKNEKLKAVPYYAWSNRGIGKMKVWMAFVP
ncbi:MAG: glycoside hydrolase family 127 protein, partial [Phaeodactylibacter sp.]|nr:glycoside hydrolase family 127 protein [Phaeodactylibacter sp.]